MKLLISAQNVKKSCFLEVNQLNARLMRVLRCHIEPVYCLYRARTVGVLVTCNRSCRDRVWQALVMLMLPAVGQLLGCPCLRNVQLGTSDILDVHKIITSEINLSVFMAKLIALKVDL